MKCELIMRHTTFPPSSVSTATTCRTPKTIAQHVSQTRNLLLPHACRGDSICSLRSCTCSMTTTSAMMVLNHQPWAKAWIVFRCLLRLDTSAISGILMVHFNVPLSYLVNLHFLRFKVSITNRPRTPCKCD